MRIQPAAIAVAIWLLIAAAGCDKKPEDTARNHLNRHDLNRNGFRQQFGGARFLSALALRP